MQLEVIMSQDFDLSNGTDIHVDLGENHLTMLNQLASNHYGRNRTQTLRRAIHTLNNQHNDTQQQYTEEQTLEKLEKCLQSIRLVTEKIDSLEEEIEKLHRQPAVEGQLNRQVSQEDIDEVYNALYAADRPLSKNGLFEQTNLDIVALGLALNTLIDESIVYETSQNNTAIDRYGVQGMNYDD